MGTDENECEKWFRADGLSFFNMPVFIENELADKINRLFPNYKIAYSKTAESSYWANHCDHYDPLQGDFFLHSEPGGAFFPLEIEENEQLTFNTVTSKFDVGIDADYSWLSNTDDVPNYAKSITLKEFLDQRE